MPTAPPLHRRKRFTKREQKRAIPLHTKQWRGLRRWQLQREPLCRACFDIGIIESANEVDHIDGNANNNNPDNYQSLCKRCHSMKTMSETIGHIAIASELWLPHVAQPTIPVNVVCGCPGAGKSDYVKRHAAPGDVVIDLDEIKRLLLGWQLHDTTTDRAVMIQALKERNKMLAMLAQEQNKTAWVVVCAPLASERAHWKQTLGAKVIVLETTPGEVERRLRDDPSRSNIDVTMQWVNGWWKRYASAALIDDRTIRY